MSCSFCGIDARHPCRNEKEASTCGNCDDQGMYLDFNDRDVIKWLRYKVRYDEEGIKAINTLEQLL